MVAYGECPMMSGQPGNCVWCNTGPLAGRRRKWCSRECEDEWRAHHWWQTARLAAVQRDGWTCVRCGFVGWWETSNPLRPTPYDPALHSPGASIEDWAVAMGLITPEDGLWSFSDHDNRHQRVAAATGQLPQSIRTLVESERRRFTWNMRSEPRGHQLEVNHIEPREGRGYNSGCHHHLENLETLCRPCHVDETTRQRRGLPSWRQDPRPIEILEGRGHQEQLL